MRGLGDLESAVMDILWRAETPLKVREVLEQLDTGKDLAYTTVMTVLDNLHRKQWAERERQGKAFAYRPAQSRAQAAAKSLREVLNESGDPEAVLLHFATTVSPEESAVLRKGLRRTARE
ncbi:BlaI/MecI/CopY family transcriptional regulator [Amycolatopsis roodepoortensis]|uniref:BlaI/MecI/CopY family transcriptional regulator n=1 Tax=Amycolatopsis roodepoortensis TaxID=700274 RepID=UPI00214AF269|nr:BlaI/MecI/CopY family transcriptional regulator [Amycolatopsis roodepoortensis]UUV29961.1 BlaI/MecI/CopY family transcriptional regulator [Amycolatopsis roodepoortensis]